MKEEEEVEAIENKQIAISSLSTFYGVLFNDLVFMF